MKPPVTTIAATLFLAGAAFAQDTPSDVAIPETALLPIDMAEVAPAELQAADVLDAAGEEFGRITSIVFTSTGEMDAAVVSAGGFLGFGRHSVAIPLEELSVSAPPDRPSALVVQLPLTEAEFKDMPEVGSVPATE